MKAATAPSPRLLAMRATSSLCIASEADWHQRHDWSPLGRCRRCGIQLRAAV